MEHLTKAEIRDAIAGIDSELAELERIHGENVDMRPWVSDDHPVSLQHWGLVQRRIRLKEQVKKAGLTPERRAALVAAGQGTRLNRASKAPVPACKSTIDPRPDPQHPPQPPRFILRDGRFDSPGTERYMTALCARIPLGEGGTAGPPPRPSGIEPKTPTCSRKHCPILKIGPVLCQLLFFCRSVHMPVCHGLRTEEQEEVRWDLDGLFGLLCLPERLQRGDPAAAVLWRPVTLLQD
jgi:hypothetical protein